MVAWEPTECKKANSRWIVALFVLLCIVLAKIIPPMQSPDEFDHAKRAYLLGKGVFTLESSAIEGSGGQIDTGLLAYFKAYGMLPYQPARKLSQEEAYAAGGVQWSGQREFSPAPGTGYYLPLIYAPQAIGLALGEQAGLTVGQSYDLARILNVVCGSLLILLSFRLYPANPWVMALLVLPMSLFQFASATIDALSLSLTIFSVSVFMRIGRDRADSPVWLLPALALSLVVLVSSRVHMLPMVALLFAAGVYTKKRVAYVLFGLTLAVIFSWLYFAMVTTLDKRISVGAGAGEVIGFYLKNPIQFLRVLGATVADREIVKFYAQSFVGVLGWLDAAFTEQTYRLYGVLLFFIAMLSISLKNIRRDWAARTLLLLCSFGAVLLTFVALLVTWNKHPADVILGIQGRYFAPPMVLIAYATAGGAGTFQGVARKCAAAVLLLLVYISISSTLSLLLNRYYLTFEPVQPLSASVRATPPLSPENPISIEMSDRHLKEEEVLVGLGIDFGTHRRKNRGVAELQLESALGERVSQTFDLSPLKDNQYAEIFFTPGAYAKGRIVSLQGGGVSVWEAELSDGKLNTCLIYIYASGKKKFTVGCPLPG